MRLPPIIEMLVVLMIISVLIILIIPNLGGKNEEITKKGCEALVSVVQAQIDSYYLDHGNYPNSLRDLQNKDYITLDQMSCANNEELNYTKDGKVTLPTGYE